MKLTCTQMDVLISFYIEGDLSTALKNQVEEHLKSCSTCRAKFDIIKSMIEDLKSCFEEDLTLDSKNEYPTTVTATSQQYRVFQDNLSAYIDNELNHEDSLKLKKFTINNKNARKELQESYNLRRLMGNSFHKTKYENKQDFTKSTFRQLTLDEETALSLHPGVKLILLFILATITITAVIIAI